MRERRWKREVLPVGYAGAWHDTVTYAADWCPGVILHRTLPRYEDLHRETYTLSHRASGSALLQLLPDAKTAVRHMRALAGLCDWTLSAADINALDNRNEIARALNEMLATYTSAYKLRVGPISEKITSAKPPLARAVRTGGET